MEKREIRPPSFIMTVPEGTVEMLREMGLELKEEPKAPLFVIGKVTPCPYPRPISTFMYGDL